MLDVYHLSWQDGAWPHIALECAGILLQQVIHSVKDIKKYPHPAPSQTSLDQNQYTACKWVHHRTVLTSVLCSSQQIKSSYHHVTLSFMYILCTCNIWLNLHTSPHFFTECSDLESLSFNKSTPGDPTHAVLGLHGFDQPIFHQGCCITELLHHGCAQFFFIEVQLEKKMNKAGFSRMCFFRKSGFNQDQTVGLTQQFDDSTTNLEARHGS